MSEDVFKSYYPDIDKNFFILYKISYHLNRNLSISI